MLPSKAVMSRCGARVGWPPGPAWIALAGAALIGVQLAARTFATNAVWDLVMSSGFVPSALYCVWLFRKHQSFKQFSMGTVNWLFGLLMGFLWMASVVLYGFGAVFIGSAGATLGWPVLMAGTVITANLLGLATREWIGTGWETKKYLFTGIGLLVLSVVIIGSAS